MFGFSFGIIAILGLDEILSIENKVFNPHIHSIHTHKSHRKKEEKEEEEKKRFSF